MALVACAAWTCSAPDRAEPRVDDSGEPKANAAEILWDGCDEVVVPFDDPSRTRCVLRLAAGPGQAEPPVVRVWVPVAPAEVAVSLGDEPVEPSFQLEVDRGTVLDAPVRHDGTLHVLAGPQRLDLEVEIRPQPATALKVERRAAVAAGGDRLRAFIVAQYARLGGRLSVEERVFVLEELRTALFHVPEYERVVVTALEQSTLAAALGWQRRACRGVWVAGYVWDDRLDRPSEARRLYDGDRCPTHARSPAEIRYWDAYYRGLVLASEGQVARATEHFEAALGIARRLQHPEDEQLALQPLVGALAGQGRFEQALRLLDRYADLFVPAEHRRATITCELEARYHQARGDLAYRALRAGAIHPAWLPEGSWLRAISAYADRESCGDADGIDRHVTDLRLRLAEVTLRRGQHVGTRAWLSMVSLDAASPEQAVRHGLLEAELWLHEGELAAARRRLDEVAAHFERDPELQTDDALRWWYHHVLARSREQAGELDAALLALDDADLALRRVQRRLSGALERDRHAAMHREAGIVRVRLHRRREDFEAAACAARLARSQGLLSEAGLDAGLHDCAGFPAPAPGEVALLHHFDESTWWAIAWRHGEAPVMRPAASWSPDDPPQELGPRLLGPVADVLAGARRVRVLPAGPMSSLAFEALELDGRPLVDSMAVTYGLDLPQPERVEPEPGTARVVFSATQLRLAAYRSDVDHWVQRLDEQGLSVSGLQQIGLEEGEPLTVARTAAHTEGTGLALLFGLARPEGVGLDLERAMNRGPLDPGAIDPDRIGLALDDDATLTPRHVPRQGSRIPRRVILAACDSALTDELGASGAAGLAQRYVLAGSSWTIGTTTLVDADSAVAVVTALIDQGVAQASAADAADALRRVQRQRHEAGDPQWHQYHLWTP